MTDPTDARKIDTVARPRPGKPLFMTEEQARGKLLSGEAFASSKRLIDAFFGNAGERPRASIPARPDYDDDLILTDALRYAEEVVRRTVQAVPDDVGGLVSELRADAELHQDLLPDRAADVILALAAEVLQLRGILNDRVQDARAARSAYPTHEQVLAHLQRCIDQGNNARPKKKQSKGTRG